MAQESCPACGASRRPDETACWNCEHVFAAPARPVVTPAGDLGDESEKASPPDPADALPLRGQGDKVIAVLLVALGIGIAVSIFTEACGLAVLMLVVFVPLLLASVAGRGGSGGMVALRVVLVLVLTALALVVLVFLACASGSYGLGNMH